MKIKKYIVDILKNIKLKYCAIRFIMAWCFISIIKLSVIRIITGIKFNDIEYVGLTSFAFEIIVNLVGFIVFYILFEHINRPYLEKKIVFAIICIYAALCVAEYMNFYFIIGILFFVVLSGIFCLKNNKKSESKVVNLIEKCDKGDKGKSRSLEALAVTVIAVAALMYIAFTGAATGLRYICHVAPNFDLGLFSQMFHYMKEDFTMNTTCERDMLLSHMCVHVSPAFYLILPAYLVFPSPLTLQIIQAVVIAAGIIPFVLICRNRKISWKGTALLAICYASYPALSGGCFYDIHENMFLPLFIMLLLYSMEKRCTWGIFLSAILTFGIKEDASVYVAVIALFMMAEYKMYKEGVVLFTLSVICFICTTTFLNSAGDGVMTYRFSNMIYSAEEGFIGMIRTILANPMYIITQIFRAEKMKFILQMFIPVLFIPLITFKMQRFILIIPLVLFNLVPDYSYQHNIFFQYVFGSGVLLLYLTILNMQDFKKDMLKRVIHILPAVSLISFAYIMYPKTDIFRYYKSASVQRNIQIINRAVKMIPKDASVTATSFLCATLSDRDELYELAYTDKTTEYIVLDLRFKTDEFDIDNYLNNSEYEEVIYERGVIAIFKNLQLDKHYSYEYNQ